jgi:5-methylcytosine-specific restriction endonuclease McrA
MMPSYPKDKQLNPTKPTKAPAPEPKKVPKRRRYLTRQERAAYTETTDRARNGIGAFLRCEDCKRPLRDDQAERHHVIYRSHGGPTTPQNLLLTCRDCHQYRHAHGGRSRSQDAA